MMIFGSKAVYLKTEQSRNATCPNCNTQGSLIFTVYRRHAHIFWIPLFPFAKRGMSQCLQCKYTLKTNEMPEFVRLVYDTVQTKSKGPIWQFTGLAMVLILLVLGMYAGSNDKKWELEHMATPQIGDVYKYESEIGIYSTLKVTRVTGDSVFVIPNDFEVSKRSQIYKIDKPENYKSLSYGISKVHLNERYHSGDIFDIKR